MTSIGPFPISAVLTLAAAVVAVLLVRRFAPAEPPGLRQQADGWAWQTLFVGFAVARLAFVLPAWRDYLHDPLGALRFGDGGLVPLAGVAAAAVFALWRTRKMPVLRRPLFGGLALGVAIWVVAGLALDRLAAGVPVSDAELMTLDSQPTQLAGFAGRPLVVNLWATWCPPCRREMPAFARAQARHPEIAFAFVNQGEDAATVSDWLTGEGLALDNVLLDELSVVMREAGSRGLPTTLFYDASGRMVDSHVGEIAAPVLAAKLKRLAPDANSGG